MSAIATNRWLESLLTAHSSAPPRPHAWVNQMRAAALERAHSLTLPTAREEDWRFTDLSPLYQLAFKPVGPTSAPTGLALEPVIAPEARMRLVFVDGQFVPALSTPSADGVVVTTLAAGLEAHGELVRSQLARHARFQDDAFRAINTAYLADGALVIARSNAAAGAPVQLVFATIQADVAIHPRCLIVAEQGAEITVLEDHVGLHEGAYCVNAVAEIVVGANARVRHIRRQQEGSGAFHIATCAVRVERDAAYESISIALGGRLSRYNLNVHQAQEGVRLRLDGLALVAARQLADTHSFIDHAAAHGASRQLHKCVVAGGGHAVFNGRILVRPGAQLTDSAQESRNLLLAPRAHVDTKPQLEIFADDVKCSHGAAVGQFEEEQLFYLRSRGLSEGASRALLTYGFAAEIVDRIPIASVVTALRRKALEQTHRQGLA